MLPRHHGPKHVPITAASGGVKFRQKSSTRHEPVYAFELFPYLCAKSLPSNRKLGVSLPPSKAARFRARGKCQPGRSFSISCRRRLAHNTAHAGKLLNSPVTLVSPGRELLSPSWLYSFHRSVPNVYSKVPFTLCNVPNMSRLCVLKPIYLLWVWNKRDKKAPTDTGGFTL